MRQIELSQGQVALVDDADYEWLNQWKWRASKSKNGKVYYAIRNVVINGKKTTQKMHHLILGDNPLKLQIDHWDGDGCDNQSDNLRFCTPTENQMNARIRENGSSIYKGVHWHKRDKKWVARIRINNKQIHLGYFDNEIDAALAYDAAAIKYHGKFARLNFPENKIQI